MKCWQGNGVDKSFMSESSVPELCSPLWGAAQEPGWLWQCSGVCHGVRSGSITWSCWGSPCSIWSCPIYMGQYIYIKYPIYASCSEKMGASKPHSLFLFSCRSREGVTECLAELEKCFAKTSLIKNKTKYLIEIKYLEKSVNSHIISMEKHFGKKRKKCRPRKCQNLAGEFCRVVLCVCLSPMLFLHFIVY